MLQKKKISLESIEKAYSLEKNTLAKSVFDPILVKSACSLALADYELDGNEFYMTIFPRISDKENTTYMVFKKRDNCYYSSECYFSHQERVYRGKDEEYISIKRGIYDFNPIKIAIEITSCFGKFYIDSLSKKYPHIEFVPIEVTEVSRKKMIRKLITYFEDRKIFFPDRVDMFNLFFENENGYIPSPYEGCILATAFLTELS